MNDNAAPPPPAASTPRTRQQRFALGVALAVALYGVAYLIWYLQTPLGRAPQLDGAENIALARQIATGTLPHEPFYRAMLYPAALAIPLKLCLPADDLPAFAAIFGLFCHFIITLGVARLAARVWVGPREKWAAVLAAALWGLNPVALFYAVDVLDTVPSLALAVWALVWWTRPGAQQHDAWVGGVLLGLAVAARPHFLPLVFVAPLARSWLAGRWRPQLSDALAWAGAAAILLGVGMVNGWYGGDYAVLPAQGPYNFYAANRPGANGKYYAQELFFSTLAPGENPARKEEEMMFAEAKKTFSGPADVYWNERAVRAIKQNPRAWLKLEIKKAYYLLNDFDQYNNKTYAWHKAESPLLQWNFLGWGILLVFSAGLLAVRGRGLGSVVADFNCPMVASMLLVFCVYAAGDLMYYASGRFRLPLITLLCVLASGWTTWPGWAAIKPRQIVLGVCALLMASFVTFSNFFNAHDESTFIQDDLLSANAAAQVGDDAQAYALAGQALARDPLRADARRIAVMSYFNLSVGNVEGYDTLAGWKQQLGRVNGLESQDAGLALAAGVASWKTGDQEQAEKIWENGAARFGPDSAPARALAAAHFLRGETVAPSSPSEPALVEYLKRNAS